MKLDINFGHIQAARGDLKEFGRDMTIEYPVNRYIQEIKREDNNRAIISFKLQTKTNSDIANFALSGNLFLEGTEEEAEVWITPSAKGLPKAWKHIYQESMNILTVRVNVIDIPFPTPKIGEVEIDNKNYL